MFRSLVAKPSHRNYRIWRGPSVFLPGLVPMCHQSRSKIHTWDPAATQKAHSSTHSGCSWLGRSREETAFYHFIYWQRCKITGDVLNRWKRGDAAKEGLRGRKQILLFVRQESCIRSIYLLCQLVVFLNLLLPPVPAAQSSPLNDVIRS